MPTENIDNLVPSTELECVNSVIGVAGENPVDNLNDPLPANVEFALNLVRQVSRGVQSKGWHFNMVRGERLTRDAANGYKITIPTDTLRLRKTITDEQREFDFAYRGTYLWDNNTNSATFDGDDYVNGVLCDVVHALDFTELPECARQLIMVMAGRRYQERIVGNAEVSGFGEKDEAFALQNLIDAESLLEETNLLFNFKDEKRANQIFDAMSKDVQLKGWKFNTRLSVAFTADPANSDYIAIPANVLKLSLSLTKGSQACLNVSHRGGFLFDIINDTYAFDPAATIYLDLIEFLEWNELPPSARRYIEIKTSRQLDPQKQVATAQNYTERDEFLALQALIDDQGAENYNMADNIAVYRTIFGRPGFYKATPH